MTLVLILSLLAAALWSLVILRWGSVFSLALALILIGIPLGPKFWTATGPIPITIDRVLWCALVGLFLVHRKWGWTHPLRWTFGDGVVASLVVVTGLSAMLFPAESPLGTRLSPWLFNFLIPTVGYAIARGYRVSAREVRWLVQGLIGMGIYLSATALLEVTGLHALVLPRYIVDQKALEFLGRARGPLMNPSANGIMLTLCLSASLVAWRQSRGRLGKVFLAMVILLELAGAYATLTRCVWLGVAALLALAVAVSLPARIRWLAMIFGVGISAVAGPMLYESFKEMKRDKNLSASAARDSIELRPLLGAIAWEMFRDSPMLGHGYGQYLENNRRFLRGHAWDLPLQKAGAFVQHNIFLSILVDCGLVGLFFFVATLGWWGATAFHLIRSDDRQISNPLGWLLGAGLIGYIINGLFQDATLFSMVHLVLMIVAGFAVGARARIGSLAKSATLDDWLWRVFRKPPVFQRSPA